MGCGYYNTVTASSYSNTLKGQSRSEIFTAYRLDSEMDIKGKIRIRRQIHRSARDRSRWYLKFF